jgi:hypothetical protein
VAFAISIRFHQERFNRLSRITVILSSSECVVLNLDFASNENCFSSGPYYFGRLADWFGSRTRA